MSLYEWYGNPLIAARQLGVDKTVNGSDTITSSRKWIVNEEKKTNAGGFTKSVPQRNQLRCLETSW